MNSPQLKITRYPVGVSTASDTDSGTPIVICADGTVWQLLNLSSTPYWDQLPSIPGTEVLRGEDS